MLHNYRSSERPRPAPTRAILGVAALGIAAACNSAPVAATPFDASAPQAVTLITGDRVTLGGADSVADVRIEPGPGRGAIGFISERRGEEVLVIPRDVLPLVASGRLDRALFDVARLVADGYSDRDRDDLPLIVTGPAGATPRRANAGIAVDRVLPALGAVAVRQRKASGGAILDGLAPGQKVWLDRVRKPSLDRSVAQIGGPAAHARGLTGAGVTVAVLDTGVDAGHLDLAGQVVAAKNFTDDGGGDGDGDIFGHGTHVASIIAGTGAASGGRYAGVAPGARLVSGRVCVEWGCLDSWILAGMEWAVVEQHAPIVNLSLGGTDTPEVDLLEEAIGRLSAEHGTLFVAAAGNFAELGIAVESPASADAALAVGAVDRDDQLGVFSARGPRVGDGAIKPEITAPGIDIVAARAAGVPPIGEPIGDAYQILSGTSMATPHVAGVAALVLEQHPDWSGGQVKAALTGAAQPNPELDVFEQGAGRVDADRATRQSIVASVAALSIGLARWPHDDDPVLTRTVTYRNTGTAPVRLALAVSLFQPDRTPALAGIASVAPAALDVPAGGTAAAIVTIDTRGDHPDVRYDGALIAAVDDVRVTTPIAVEREVESYELTIRATDRAGAQGLALMALFDVSPTGLSRIVRVDGELTLRLPRAVYSLVSFDAVDPVMLAYPRIALDQAMTVDMDARLAQPMEVTVRGRDVALRFFEASYLDLRRKLALRSSGIDALYTGSIGPDAPADEVRSWALASNVVPESVSPTEFYLVGHQVRGHHISGWREVIDPRQLARVDARHLGNGESTWRKNANAVLSDAPELGLAGGSLAFADYAGPFERTEYFYGAGFDWAPEIYEQSSLEGTTYPKYNVGGELRAGHYRAGKRYSELWNQAPYGPAFAPRLLPAARRVGDTLHLEASMISGQATPPRISYTALEHERIALFRDGQLVSEAPFGSAFLPPVAVPPGPATYRYTHELDRENVRRANLEPIRDLSTHVSAAWTFRSQHVDGTAVLPLPVLRFTPALDDTNSTGAPVLILPATIERPAGAPTPRINHARVEASFDDGATWKRLPAVLIGDRLFAVVVHPPGTRYVSLRGAASDVDGNAVEQTIIHAYRVR